MKQPKTRHSKKYTGWLLYGATLFSILILNVLAWLCPSFCDWFRSQVFPVSVNCYGRLTGLVPFSVGELLLLLAGGMLLVAALMLPVSIVRKRISRYYVVFAWTALAVGALMTFNCTILYHASTFAEIYYKADSQEGSLDELYRLYNFVAAKANCYAETVSRDDEGWISLSEEKAKERAVADMQALGAEYSELAGFYPSPKPLLFSDFMCQQDMSGWYFPFSMEANYNDVMYDMNFPSTFCHELAHLKGFMYEDECNFISYLACINSDDIYFQYSGYLSVLGYLQRDLIKEIKAEPERFDELMADSPLVLLDERIITDSTFVTDEEWARIDKNKIVSNETAAEVTDKLADASMKLNGVSDGRVSYSRVVSLLLLHYRHNPEAYLE